MTVRGAYDSDMGSTAQAVIQAFALRNLYVKQSLDSIVSHANEHFVGAGRNSDAVQATIGCEKNSLFFVLSRLSGPSFFSSQPTCPNHWLKYTRVTH